MSKKLQVTLVKSPIGYNKRQKATVQSLGLGRLNSTAIHDDTPPIRGMIQKIIHLVEVEEIDE
ncbi:MAG: 50S ribosomal protein L30 [Chloroflexi bacterium]|nr:50S ribosomal protein L30 [Chloroflexota bacterium]